MNKLTLGSLFDGSGGFPLGGLLCGIEPLWASEIEPFPIRVTTKRIPFMKHYGDISKLNGADLPPVDIITFGSPCTDMSVAGRRAGLGGEQSVLFYEAIRVIKEMRCKTHGKYPRYAVWENVPGAFSSNEGADFEAVLEAVVGIVEPNTEVSVPENGRWPYADIFLGDGWSVAYRTIDAQYFGVPQRRRRIYLVADFAGECAGEILFEHEGVSRDFAPSGSPWKRTAGDAEECVGASGDSVTCLNDQGGSVMSVSEDVSATLRAEEHGHPPCVIQSSGFCTEHSAKSRSVGYEEERSPTLRAGVVPGVAIENHPTDGRCKIETDGKVQTLTSRMGTGGMNVPLVMNARQYALAVGEDLANTLTGTDYKGTQCVFEPTAYGICSDKSNSMRSANPHSGIYKAETSRTIDQSGINPSCNQGGIAVVALQGSMIGRDDKNGPQGSGIDEDVSFTLNTIDRHAIAYDCRNFTVNDEISGTLQAKNNGGHSDNYINPVVYGIDRAAYNQGQNAQFNISVKEELAQTVLAKGPGAVVQPYQKVCGTLSAGAHPGGFNGQDAYSDMLVTDDSTDDPNYIVRRLTPTECARLQGFPDYWCADLAIGNPTEEDIDFWSEVWETHRRIVGTSEKPKSRKQIVKWLRDPHSDAAEYKMWGNGVALPCVCFVLIGIVSSTQETAE